MSTAVMKTRKDVTKKPVRAAEPNSRSAPDSASTATKPTGSTATKAEATVKASIPATQTKVSATLTFAELLARKQQANGGAAAAPAKSAPAPVEKPEPVPAAPAQPPVPEREPSVAETPSEHPSEHAPTPPVQAAPPAAVVNQATAPVEKAISLSHEIANFDWAQDDDLHFSEPAESGYAAIYPASVLENLQNIPFKAPVKTTANALAELRQQRQLLEEKRLQFDEYCKQREKEMSSTMEQLAQRQRQLDAESRKLEEERQNMASALNAAQSQQAPPPPQHYPVSNVQASPPPTGYTPSRGDGPWHSERWSGEAHMPYDPSMAYANSAPFFHGQRHPYYPRGGGGGGMGGAASRGPPPPPRGMNVGPPHASGFAASPGRGFNRMDNGVNMFMNPVPRGGPPYMGGKGYTAKTTQPQW